MYQDYKDLLSAFQSHGVRYLIVGGFAVIYHSQPRFTKDMDLFVKADPENAKTVYAALAESADDLIVSKLASGRPRDLADVDDLRKAAESQRPAARKKPPEPPNPNR
jgi:Nucleotidyl transferase of unknown function (DUF2204)